MNAPAAGAQLARERLRGAWPLAVPCVLGLAILALSSFDSRGRPIFGLDALLQGPVFGIAIPILAYAALARVTGGRRLDTAVDAAARFGVERRGAVLGLLAVAIGAVATLSAALAVLAVLASRSSAPGLVRDLLVTGWIGALGGSVYTLYFGAASRVGRRGAGRAVVFLLDFLLGGGHSAIAAPWPRSHLRNLLGGDALFGMPQRAACLVLVVMGIFCFGIALAGLESAPEAGAIEKP